METLNKDVLYEIFLLVMGMDFCRKEITHGPCKTLMLVCKKWYNILRNKTVRMTTAHDTTKYGYYLFVEMKDRSIRYIQEYETNKLRKKNLENE